MGTELFDLFDLDSIVREIFREKKSINLRDYNINTYEPPKNSIITHHQINNDLNAGKEIRKAIEPTFRKAEKKGYPENLFTSGYEAFLNAYQHGNQENPHKRITTIEKITDKEFLYGVIDEGGIIDAEFIPYILGHRKTDLTKKFLNFYEFTEKPQPDRNNGTGTSFMHVYTDEITYYKSKEGGLVVEMKKHKQ